MRTDLQLIQSALGCSHLVQHDLDRITRGENIYIHLYSVEMPDKFKGLPSKWYFGVFHERDEIADEQEIYDEAYQIIKDLLAANEMPIVFISDDIKIHFANELSFREHPVFFLDKFELPGKDKLETNARDTPVILSAKRKFKTSEVSFHLSPYLPNRPVFDWRFFGRKKEIKQLVESQVNCFVVGARRIGKTSLLQEVKRQLVRKGEVVYWIECQYKVRMSDVIAEMCKNLSFRDYHRAQQSGKLVDFNFFVDILKRLRGSKKNVVLIFDEIGNVISQDKSADSWRFIGALREISQNYPVRSIASAFQEVIIRQFSNFEGPFVNFGNTIRINSFTQLEVDDLLIYPLNFWGKIKDKNNLSRKIKNYFGSHPLVLQYLGQKLFELLTKEDDIDVDQVVDSLIIGNELLFFEQAVIEIFFNIESYLERFIFLTFCVGAEKGGRDITNKEITQAYLNDLLLNVGIRSDLDSRRLFLDRLVLRGLLMQDSTNRSIYRIDCPIVYTYVKKFYSPVEDFTNDYLGEIDSKILKLDEH